MKHIMTIVILMTLYSEVYASGCITGYACALSDLKKQENIETERNQDIAKQTIKLDSKNKAFNKKDKKQIEYRDLFKFKEVTY